VVSKIANIVSIICWDLKCESLGSTLDVLECNVQTNDDCYSILTSGWASLIGLVPL
jgi:uncharacterized membrane protein